MLSSQQHVIPWFHWGAYEAECPTFSRTCYSFLVKHKVDLGLSRRLQTQRLRQHSTTHINFTALWALSQRSALWKQCSWTGVRSVESDLQSPSPVEKTSYSRTTKPKERLWSREKFVYSLFLFNERGLWVLLHLVSIFYIFWGIKPCLHRKKKTLDYFCILAVLLQRNTISTLLRTN